MLKYARTKHSNRFILVDGKEAYELYKLKNPVTRTVDSVLFTEQLRYYDLEESDLKPLSLLELLRHDISKYPPDIIQKMTEVLQNARNQSKSL